jgi:hypothetical protein
MEDFHPVTKQAKQIRANASATNKADEQQHHENEPNIETNSAGNNQNKTKRCIDTHRNPVENSTVGVDQASDFHEKDGYRSKWIC